MSEILLSVADTGKKFCRSLKRSLWYGMKDLAAELLGSTRSHSQLRPDEFWANEDISFELFRGHTLGLIGRNGAGKTTLLRMLNGLIKPDKGRIEVRGRMQALIALGAGFHPILTGRENVYVNAAVLGFSRRETDKKFAQIVDFSGIGDFIDSPVQSYSSGMMVRLGFAVAAHMEPDILLIDEILAVGDTQFRRKCFAKIREFRTSGTGIIIVTHDMSQVFNLCDTAILLSQGRMTKTGTPEEVIKEYWERDLRSQKTDTHTSRSRRDDNSEAAVITGVTLRSAAGHTINEVRTGESMIVQIDFEARELIADPLFGIALGVPGADGSYLTAFNTKLSKYVAERIEGKGSIFCKIESIPLYPGKYELLVTLSDDHGCRYDSREGDSAVRFTVKPGLFGGGEFYTKHKWFLEGEERAHLR